MSTSLYNEALNAAEELKFATEEKVKQNLIEAMTPQIKLMVEQNIMSEMEEEDECGSESDVKENDEYGHESDDKDDKSPRTTKKETLPEQDEEVELSNEARSILSKIIDSNSKRAAISKKLSEIKKNITILKKAALLAESSNNKTFTKKRINQVYKNLVSEIKNISSYDIIKKDEVLLNEFYKVIKELNNMSRRQTRRSRYLNEDLETLLEMNLFEEDEEGDSAEDDSDEVDMMASDAEDEENPFGDMDMEGMDEDAPSSVTAETTVEELASMAGLMESGEDEEESADEDLDEADDHDEALDEVDELAEMMDDADEGMGHEGLSSSSMERYDESSRRGGDLFLEIDENMLKREISKMKRLREGEAKDMASHFGGGSLEGEMFVDGVELNKLHEMKIKAAKVVRQNRQLNSKLSQYKKALRGMKGQLAEMNLFNAKLLYANKLMQNKDLSMKQQRHIVESLDEAKTLGEAKILFESLSKSLVRRTSNTNSNTLTEGARRRTSGSSSRPVRSAQTLNESVALDRWATLAGIK